MVRPTDVDSYTLQQWEQLNDHILAHTNDHSLFLIMAIETPFIRKDVFTSFMRRFSSYQYQQVQIAPSPGTRLDQLKHQLSKTYKYSDNRTLIRHLIQPFPFFLEYHFSKEGRLEETVPLLHDWGQNGKNINVLWTDFLGLNLYREWNSSEEAFPKCTLFFDGRLESPIAGISLNEINFLSDKENSQPVLVDKFSSLEKLINLSPESSSRLPHLLDEAALPTYSLNFLKGELAFRLGQFDTTINLFVALSDSPELSNYQQRQVWKRLTSCLQASGKEAETPPYLKRIGNSLVQEEKYLEAGKMFLEWGGRIVNMGFPEEGAILLEEGLSSLTFTDSPELDLKLHVELAKAYKENEDKRNYHQGMAEQLSQQHNIPYSSTSTKTTPPKVIREKKNSKEVSIDRRGFLGKFFRLSDKN